MQYRVLIVDDHDAFRDAARALLATEGFDVVAEAGTAEEALLAARATRPDLVLLDVQLPDRDGIDVAFDLARLPDPPAVVLVSSRSARSYGSRLRGAPVRGFLGKGELGGHELRRLLRGQGTEQNQLATPSEPSG